MNTTPKCPITFTPFSRKQRQIFSWWHPNSPVRHAIGIICDGSVRAGKTLPMSMSFIEWAFHYFENQQFGICGKTLSSLRRNVIFWLKPLLKFRGYTVHENIQEKLLTISKNGKTNYFYLFGGKDEASQNLIQGVTLAGVLFDEVALMPESFVNQATARCSVEGSKYWFNCNPDSPNHWFKKNWLDKAAEKRLLHLHFTMDDNPSLSEEIHRKLKSLYFGVFYKRFILGLWVVAEGVIFDMFGPENVYQNLPKVGFAKKCDEWICCDYGTQNAMVFLYVLDNWENIWIEDEYYYSGRETLNQKTDSQYADDLDDFCKGRNIRGVVIDPSAASFIAELRNRGYRVVKADNDVEDGIRLMATLIGRRILLVNERCVNFLKEVAAYAWDTKKTDKGKEVPIKRDDHTMDSCRYWIKTLFNPKRLMQ